jgi:adenylylsulfate kinase-like enzyme
MIIWFTGQPGAGKTTLALKLIEEKKSANPELNIVHIDGDNLREITQNFDYSLEGRKKNIENVHTIARFMDFYGALVVISVVAPLRIMRDNLKETNKMIEVYVHTTNVRGREKNFAKNYEAPEKNFIDIDTTVDSVEESISKILKVF